MRLTYLRRAAAALLAALTAPAVLTGFPVQSKAADSITFTETTDTLLNPGMGYTSTLWYRCAPGKTQVQNPTGALVLMFVDIGAFSSGENGTADDAGNYTPGIDYPLDDTFFAAMRGTLENCRANGCTVALRFRYDDDGTRDPEPATFDMLKSHIRQIDESGLLRDFSDILMYVESGFVGCYGEQWGGKYCSLEQKAELLDLLLDIVPDPIPVTVRTPNIFAKWAGISAAELADWTSEPGSRAARVGLYDDGYMGSDSDLGTYSDRAAETAWLGRQTVSSYFGGEFSGNLEFAQKYDTYLPQNAIPEMYRTHLSYINSNIFALYQNYTFGAEYDVSGVDNSAYYGVDVRKFIRDHLGYRFVLRSADIPGTVQQGGTLSLQFSVENTGFANPIRAQRAELLLEKDGQYLRTEIPVDSRQWRSCTVSEEAVSAVLPGGIEPGQWNVLLKLSVGDNDVAQVNLRSVQLANAGIWQPALGANRIGTVTVTATDDPAAKTHTGFGSGDGTVYTLSGRQITDGAESYPGEFGTVLAETETGKLWLNSDEQYLYITAQYAQTADAEVHNFQLDNADTGEHYWLYYASNGFIYFNRGTPDGCLQRHGNGIVELRVPFGDVMGLAPGVTLNNIRYFLQDSANEWKLCSDVTVKAYTVGGSFPVYTGERTVTLAAGSDLALAVADGASQPAKYQWKHDGKAIAGANTAAYTVTNADAAAKGVYSVEITSAGGITQEAVICTVADVTDAAQRGDVNADGAVTVSDAVLLQRYLLTAEKTLPAWRSGDLDGNGRLNGADLTLLKRILAGRPVSPRGSRQLNAKVSLEPFQRLAGVQRAAPFVSLMFASQTAEREIPYTLGAPQGVNCRIAARGDALR